MGRYLAAMRWVAIALLAAAVGIAIAIVSCGSGTSVRAGRIVGAHTVQGQSHTIYFVVETDGTCFGTEKDPELAGIKVEERGRRNAILVASVRYFPNHGSGCAGLGFGVRGSVHTRRPVSHLAVYDGSEDPPRHLGVSEMTRREFRREVREGHREARISH